MQLVSCMPKLKRKYHYGIEVLLPRERLLGISLLLRIKNDDDQVHDGCYNDTFSGVSLHLILPCICCDFEML